MRPWKSWLLLIDINMFWYEIFNVKITLVESLLKSWKMIHPQSYQYFAKLTILPVIFAWAITIVACIVVGEPWFLVVCFAPYHAPPLPSYISKYKKKQNIIRTVSQLFPSKSSRSRVFFYNLKWRISWILSLLVDDTF